MTTIAQAFIDTGKAIAVQQANSALSTKSRGKANSVRSIATPKPLSTLLVNAVSPMVLGKYNKNAATIPLKQTIGSSLATTVTGLLPKKTLPAIKTAASAFNITVDTPRAVAKNTFKKMPSASTVTSAMSKKLPTAAQTTPTVFNVTLDKNTKSSIAQSSFKRGTVLFTSQTLGYTGDFGRNELSSNQLVSITLDSGTDHYVVRGKLQKDFTLNISSEWEALIPPMAEFEDISRKVQMVSSAVGMQTSLGSPITSRRIWKGSSAASMTVELMFMAINEGKTLEEVVLPCLRLQNLILPAYGDKKIFGLLPILNPPGPNPLSFDSSGKTGGDQVTIDIGGLFTMNPVIVKSISVTYDNKLDEQGLPISAKATVNFETYQVMTKSDMLTAFHQPIGAGVLSGGLVQTKEANFSTAQDMSSTVITSAQGVQK